MRFVFGDQNKSKISLRWCRSTKSRHAVDRTSGATRKFLDSREGHAERWTQDWEAQRASAVYNVPKSKKTVEIEDELLVKAEKKLQPYSPTREEEGLQIGATGSQKDGVLAEHLPGPPLSRSSSSRVPSLLSSTYGDLASCSARPLLPVYPGTFAR